jgi:hypothetical protein
VHDASVLTVQLTSSRMTAGAAMVEIDANGKSAVSTAMDALK